MKLTIQKKNFKLYYIKAIEWGKLISITSGAQLVVQVTTVLSGILTIRLLPTSEYALYTLVNTMLGAMMVLADSGIASGVMAQGGKVWQDREKLGAVMTTGLQLRKKLAIIALLVVAPLLLYLLLHHGASPLVSSLIMLCLIPAFYASLSDIILEVPLKLRQEILPLQKNQVEVSLSRLILTGLTVFLFPFTFVAVLAGGLPRIWANIRLTKISGKFADLTQNADADVKTEIVAFVKRFMPGAIYYCISGQITIWVISIFGSTTAVAQIGALGRISMILGLFVGLFSFLVIPRFARLTKDSPQLRSRYVQLHFGLLLFSAIVISFVWIFQSQFLWVLGSGYADLNDELILSIIGSCMGLISGQSFTLATSRGWAIKPIISIPISILAMVLGILLFDISTLRGVLIYNIFLGAIQVIVNATYGYIKIVKTQLA
jgi:O-antigen/teichoic acid export membrane protein